MVIIYVQNNSFIIYNGIYVEMHLYQLRPQSQTAHCGRNHQNHAHKYITCTNAYGCKRENTSDYAQL